MPREGSGTDFDAILQGADILLDCLPGEQSPRMARLARKFNTHYANTSFAVSLALTLLTVYL
jgi:hypothetical protein